MVNMSKAQIEYDWYVWARYVPAMIKWVPRTAPEGNRSPGGNEVPVMSAERSVILKSALGSGENTSNSRLTSVNL